MADEPALGRHPVALLDERAATTPDKPLYSIANDPSDPSRGWRDISYGRFANSVNRVTQYLIDILGGRGTKFETIAYVGHNDTRYPMLMMAAIKAGYKVLFISPRNTTEGHVSLFEHAEAIAAFYGREFGYIMDPVAAAVSIPAHVVPTEEEWLDPTPVKQFSLDLDRPIDEIARDPALVLHTSGSTGIPKPITMRIGSFLVCDAYQKLRSAKHGRAMWMGAYLGVTRFFSTLPLFHAGGIMQVVNFSMYYDFVGVLSPPGKPITTDTVINAVDYAKCDSGVIPPSILLELSGDAAGIERLRKWKWILTGGGPTSDTTVERLRGTGVFVANPLGATETIPLPLLQTTPDEFPYMISSEPGLGGLDFRRVPDSDEELYELWVKRVPGSKLQGVFYTFPELDEYNTRDVFRKVPGKEDFWKYYARSDDIIVFSNGEKLNPVDIEGKVQSHPGVQGAVVVGQERFQAALLVEPREYPHDEAEKEALIETIWPLVDEINQATVTHGVVLKKFIRLATPDKPFPRAGKGTVQRAAVNKLYAAEIDELYAQAGTTETAPLAISLDSEEALAQSLVEAFQTTLDLQGVQLDANTDLFSVGIDSMRVLTMARNLKIALDAQEVKLDPQTITPRAVYAASTLGRLAHILYAQVTSATVNGGGSVGAGVGGTGNVAELRELVAKFTKDLPVVTPSAAATADETRAPTYAITGTTGTLGPYLLAQTLASRPAHVFALNRDPAAAKRQVAAHQARGLTTDFSQVTFLTVDLSRPDLGVSSEQLQQLQSRTTRIIHNAWPVNFNIPMSSFVPSIAGVRHLVDLAATASTHPHITFVSSIGTVGAATGPVQETASPLESAILPYGQSKAISSAILDAARERGVKSASVRVGQIAGPLSAQGEWNKTEWFPTLIASSAGMGLIPATAGALGARVDWLPVEAIAGTVLDISTIEASGYYHAVNPAAIGYADILPAISQHLAGRAQVVGLDAWVAELERRAAAAQSDEDVKRVPGIKLLEFFQGIGAPGPERALETRQTEAVSETLRSIGPVQVAWVENWLRQWGF